MEWKKAKTIMLVALIITNLVLGALYLQKIEEKKKRFREEEKLAVQVQEYLAKEGVKIRTIPMEAIPMRALTVMYQIYNSEELAKNCLGDYVLSEIEETMMFEGEVGILSVKNEREIFYQREGWANGALTEEDVAEDIAMQFMTQMGLSTDDCKLTFSQIRGNGIRLEYTQIYENYYLEKSKMSFTIDKLGVKEFRRYWLVPMKEVLGINQLKPASNALLELLGNPMVQGREIVNMSPSFYYDYEIFSKDGIYSTKKAQAVLSWRIQMDDGTVVFVEGN